MDQEYRDILPDVDTEALTEIVNAFAGLSGRLNDEIELILYRLGETPTQAQINAAVEAVSELIQEELDDFSGYIKTTLTKYESISIEAGLAFGLAALLLAGLSEPQTVPDASAVMDSMLAVGSPLYKRLQIYGAWHADQIAEILRNTIRGNQPMGAAEIAKIIRAAELAVANALADAMRMTRTALLYAYREATRLQYMANSDYVTGWQWSAELDERVCMSCVVMHGTIHPLTETLNDHHNGRCAMLPIVGEPVIAEDAGRAWFGSLSAAQQKALMGNGKHEAWAAGAFDLSALSATYDDEVYGVMRREASLKELEKGRE